MIACSALFATNVIADNKPNITSKAAAATKKQSFSPNQVKNIEQIVRDYIINNPEILVEASRALQAKEMAKAQKEAMQAIANNKSRIFNDDQSPVVGNKDGDVVLVEFFDYQCGHCKAMVDTIKTLKQQNKNVKIIFKELPIFGDNSRLAAKAALAAMKQNKFFELHEALLTTDNPLNEQKIFDAAKKVGLDIDQLKKDIKNPDIEKQLQDNFKLAQDLKIMGTPAFIISNKAATKFRFIPGALSLENLKTEIAKVSNNKNTTQQ